MPAKRTRLQTLPVWAGSGRTAEEGEADEVVRKVQVYYQDPMLFSNGSAVGSGLMMGGYFGGHGGYGGYGGYAGGYGGYGAYGGYGGYGGGYGGHGSVYGDSGWGNSGLSSRTNGSRSRNWDLDIYDTEY